MLSTPERLHAIRRVYRRRAEARSARDTAFALYVVVFLLGVVGAPAVVLLVRALGHPVALRALESAGAGQTVSLLCGIGLAAMAGLGALRGPVALSPFLAHLFAVSDMARRDTLLRPFLIPTGAVVTGAAVILSGVLLHVGGATLTAAVWFTLAVAGYGVLLSVAWLGGQILGPARAWRLPGLILLAVAATSLVPVLAFITPWGSLGLLWPASPAAGWWPAAVLALFALAALGCTPRLLDAVGGPALQEQASRWQTAGTFAAAADFAGALEHYRASPRAGRHWRAVLDVRPVIRFMLRDLIGAGRTPGRLVVGSSGLVLAGWLTSLSFALDEFSWIPGVVGVGLGYAAVGVLADGLRHASEAASAPALYGHSTAGLFWLHSLFPALWTLTCMLLGVLLTWPPELGSFAGTAALGGLLVMARAFDCAKGFMPAQLMNPAPSPAGDISGLLVLAWQFDAPLLIMITAGITHSTFDGTAAAIGLGYLLLALAILARTRGRIQDLSP